MPSLFEACSLPVFEAWAEGVPVACSSATALPDQVLDATIMFDPYSIESMAEAIAKIVTDPKTQKNLRTSGFRRSKDFDWQRTAKAYRAVYRRTAGYPLTEEDRWLLSWDWMKKPQRELENQ
jgi:glycosyltransferase involved in cell wall biosynthesis